MSERGPADDEAARPFVAPCRSLPATAPLGWIRKGWIDVRRAPRQSLAYGVVIALLSWAVTGIALRFGNYWAVLVLLSGFVFVAPVLALGLYSISRQLESGLEPSLARCFGEQRRGLGTAMVFALALLVVFLVWARAGSMVHVFFPVEAEPDWTQIATFLAIGSAVGSVFALLTFAFSAFSLPMICDRDADAVTAVVTSVNAVLRNKAAMAVWVALIVTLTAIGFATALVGLAVTIPLLGHATWHGYRETVDASAWPANGPAADRKAG
ncbi:MAG: hypothetical protein AMJ58_04065 [Gammaproteobacteria bacterium SG8_30]|nr:MAG: hypothetical protein AMJ58_04065 [Gammaproteobacteria bacterium SG8_30]